MKFKRYISTLLSALVLFSNIGLALNVHYCHGSVSAVTLSYKSEQCSPQKQQMESMACCAKAAAEKKCCKNHSVKIQDKSEKTLVKSLQLSLASFYIAETYKPVNLFYTAGIFAEKNTIPAFYADSNAPPLYKLHCQYVLYA